MTRFATLTDDQVDALSDKQFFTDCGAVSDKECDARGEGCCTGCRAWEGLKSRIASGAAGVPVVVADVGKPVTASDVAWWLVRACGAGVACALAVSCAKQGFWDTFAPWALLGSIGTARLMVDVYKGIAAR